MKNVVILGATGSIGSQALDYIKLNPTKFRLLGATCGKDIFGLLRIAKEFSPKYVGIGDESLVPVLTEELKKANLNVEVLPPESVASLGSADVTGLARPRGGRRRAPLPPGDRLCPSTRKHE